jgi:hypothetical protein
MAGCQALFALALLALVPGDEKGRSAEPRSLAETETMAREELARVLRVDAADVQVLRSSPRTWPDAHLGCSVRKGLEEPRPVAGYEIVLGHQEKRYTYRADRLGQLRRCDRPSRPIDRIGG